MDVELRQERMDFWYKDHGHSEAGRRAVNFGVPGPLDACKSAKNNFAPYMVTLICP